MLGVFGASAYHGVRDAAVERSSERLASVARELAAGISRGVVARARAMRTLARDTSIVVALNHASVPNDGPRVRAFAGVDERPVRNQQLAAHRQALDSLFAQQRSPSDTALLGWHLISADGTSLYGTSLATGDSIELATVVSRAMQTDSVVHSELYESESQIRLFVATRVTETGVPLGVILTHRVVLGSDSMAGVFKRLTGQNASVAYANVGSEVWSSVKGDRIPSPLGERALRDLPDTGTVRVELENGQARYVASSSIVGAPWRIVLTEAEESILVRARELIQELLFIAITVLLIGTVGAWWLSQLETRPLTDLRNAADAMASGDYTQTVTPTGAQETAALADAFNTMSTRISGAHATLHAQNEALLRANEAKARFLAVMSHELRTPLNAIGGYAELMALGVHGPTTKEQRIALERIGHNKEQLLHLVSDILSYARLEATPLRMERELVSVQQQFETARNTVAEQFERKRVQLVIIDSPALLCADPVRVQQILLNLVTNALQFTAPGGRVDMYAEMMDDTTTLFVRDTGVGIAPEAHESIFEAFVQVDDTLTRLSGGTGLGLAIVRQLATAMGGDVRMESTPGVGSTFSVTLPSDEHVSCEDAPVVPVLVGAER